MELDKDKLLDLYPSYDSVLGPYLRPDGRKHVILNNSSAPKGQKGKTRTISYPKALVESNIGRVLLPNETIDHNDRDKTNDDGGNLIIRDRSVHASLDAVKVNVEDVICLECGIVFTPTVGQRNNRSNKDVAGPFCSRTCTGKYGARIQNGDPVMSRQEIVKTYYKDDK